MADLEKYLLIRNYPFLSHKEKLFLVDNFSLDQLYNLTLPFLEDSLSKNFKRKPTIKKVYPKLIHNQEYILGLQDIKVCLWGSVDYPFLLKEIYDPPFMLFYKGNLPTESSIGVVGSRKAGSLSVKKTEELGRNLGLSDISVLSGLAHGIDSAIHRGVVSSLGRAFAIMATSIDNIYPKENKNLAGSILYNGGGLISETAPQEVVGRYSFAKRNRIISGLSQGVLVMQAAEKSGALITAQCALDQGREVFIWNNSEAGRGALSFLEQGANSYTSPEDIFSFLDKSIPNLNKVENIETSSFLLNSQGRVGEKVQSDLKLSIEDKLIEDLMKELGI